MSSLGRQFYTKRFFIFSFINVPVHILFYSIYLQPTEVPKYI